MFNDPLAAALAKILNAEKVGKREVLIKPASKMIKTVLGLLNEHSYLGNFEEINDEKGGLLKVNLLGNINKCGVIKPRFSTKHNVFEKWEKRYLPAKDFGIILITTPQGIMTHLQAKEKNLGGKLLVYCY
ncbi:30S ribosomal protein S8 [Candidatus Woesearchaeota archaeon]|nr:30S ribosomal protein S8 [Candidatus Woesearchaeota archaeon]